MPRRLTTFVSVVLYVLAFPKFNLSILAWVALVPLIYLARTATPGRSFWLGWLSGTLAYMALLYWFFPTFAAAHLSTLFTFFCLLLLSLFLGLYWGVWAALISTFRGQPILAPLFAAATWTALEYVRSFLFTGFPWALLGDTQWHQLPILQISRWAGVYGISFLIVLINATLADAWLRRGQGAGRTVTLALVSLAATAVYGQIHIQHYRREPPVGGIHVALLQGCIDQYKKWDRQYVQEIENTYSRLALEAARDRPDLIVWPETAIPGYFSQDAPVRAWLDQLIHRTGTNHLIGAPNLSGNNIAYNAALTLNANGQLISEYDKTHLVPFGEWVPLPALLSRWVDVLNDLGGFTPGDRSSVLLSSGIPVSVSICYEAIFPDLVRRSVRQGAVLIANLTNDGWYMQTAAPYQHFVPNILRAVENDRWTVRADNTGISAIINPIGAVIAASPIFVPRVVTGTVYPRTTQTFYTRHGNVFAWLCIGFCFILLLRDILRRRDESRTASLAAKTR